jgi:transposase-like protein
MAAPSIKSKEQWYYLSRAVDTHGQTMALLRTEPRDKEAALRLLKQAI